MKGKKYNEIAMGPSFCSFTDLIHSTIDYWSYTDDNKT
jgi:hypothetical protein